ncbi:MAG: outer membrane protein transport protein, partial [Alphaproteobacteria bacterium]|nr:outer membrane protein transport protein [Alphaproteobacteria bacterium]
KNDTGDGTKMHYGVPLPSAFGQWNVNDKWFLGAGFYVPFGLSTKHKNGSFIAQAPNYPAGAGGTRVSELEVMDTAVAAAYKATDKLSLGATLIYRYIHGNMTGNVNHPTLGTIGQADYDLDGWTWTGNFGAMYEFTPDTRVGISYRMKSKQTVKGDYTNTALAMMNQPTVYDDGRASPDLPSSIILSGYHKLNDKLGLSASAKWTHWAVFKKFTMIAPSLPASKQEHDYRYRNSWTLSLGADVYLTDRLTWRFGTAYDQSPVKSSAHRSNRIPDVTRYWLTTGLSYEFDNWQVDFGYAHLFMKKGRTDNAFSVPAEYSSYSNMYGLNLQYKF